MSEGPLVAVPHWRAPTWERTKFYYDALEAGGARYVVVEDEDLPVGARGLLLTGGVDVGPHPFGEKGNPLADRPNCKGDAHEMRLLRQAPGHARPPLCLCPGPELPKRALG